MSFVFISYARDDVDKATHLARELEEKGWKAWTDRDIPPGATWADTIGARLEDAACVVVLWSQTSVRSDWVTKEARRGMHRHMLVPVIIEPVDIPKEFAHIQAADITKGVFQAKEQLESLLREIEHHVTQSRIKQQRRRSESMSLFTTIFTCVVLALLLGQILAYETLDELLTGASGKPYAFAPFLPLFMLLFTAVEHWRVLHVTHRENDIVTLYLDITTFGVAFVAASGYLEAIAVPAGNTGDFDSRLQFGTNALVGFLGLVLLRYIYSIWIAKTLRFVKVRLELAVIASGFGLAFAGIFVSNMQRIHAFLWLGSIGVISIILYVFLHLFRGEKPTDRNGTRRRSRHQADGSAPV